MKSASQYSIPFVSLKVGKHAFTYRIDDAFFKHFEYSPVKFALVQAAVLFDKQQENIFHLTFELSGELTLVCERCLGTFKFPIQSTQEQVVKIVDQEEQKEILLGDLLVLRRSAHEINVAPMIYEFINLAVPLIHRHPEGVSGEPACDSEMMEVLKKMSRQVYTNVEDPRWAVLNKLKNN